MNDIVERIANGSAQLLGIDDICQRLSISRTTFDRWVRNGGGKNPGSKTTLGAMAADSIIGSGFADRIENMNEGMITFPPPDIRIGNSPKWEMQTFKRWLKANAQPGK